MNKQSLITGIVLIIVGVITIVLGSGVLNVFGIYFILVGLLTLMDRKPDAGLDEEPELEE
jgi:membrane-bound ClpP family serine protease